MSQPVPTGLRRVVAASTAGTVIEWYEFVLYGTAATLVFNNILAAFVTYAVGFLARPLASGSRTSGSGPMTDLAGRIALVTGGASGIGAACARELAARGADRHRGRRRRGGGEGACR